MKSAHKVPRAALVVSLVTFLSTTLLATAGCWFTPGKEGFVCKSSKDCKKGLRCRSYRHKGKTRKQCRPYSARTISSKSGYTTYAIYMSYGFWILLPFGVVFAVIKIRRQNRKIAADKTLVDPPGGGPA